LNLDEEIQRESPPPGESPGLTQPSILSGSVNEYRLQLGRYKAGTCDAA